VIPTNVVQERCEEESVFPSEKQQKRTRWEYSVSKNQLKPNLGVGDYSRRRKPFNSVPRTENRFDDNKTSHFIFQSG